MDAEMKWGSTCFWVALTEGTRPSKPAVASVASSPPMGAIPCSPESGPSQAGSKRLWKRLRILLGLEAGNIEHQRLVLGLGGAETQIFRQGWQRISAEGGEGGEEMAVR
jgi:hypothetical protein